MIEEQPEREDAFTKALLERFRSLRHVKNLLRGKHAATVLTGLGPDVLDSVNQSLAGELRDYERMEFVCQLTTQGNVPCLTLQYATGYGLLMAGHRFGLPFMKSGLNPFSRGATRRFYSCNSCDSWFNGFVFLEFFRNFGTCFIPCRSAPFRG